MRHARLGLSIALLFGLILACAPTTHYMPIAGVSYRAKPANCTFSVLTLAPQRPFVELGTFSGLGVDNPAALFHLVRKEACEAGADAVVAVVNGQGVYVQATAIRWAGARVPNWGSAPR